MFCQLVFTNLIKIFRLLRICCIHIKLRTFHVSTEVRYRDPITRSGQLGLRENRLGHSSAGMCCRTHAYMGAWIEVCKNVIKRTITNHMVAPTEVRGLKFCGTVDRSVHIYDLLKRFHFEAFFVF